ncbi:hypothetical protein [Synechococcus sp. EJ6-Ellesmere]|uniref:hypothetical protein n=1 Tax=Synechococcus sp. EJ6-Ellesmere TaxID=2823734 RepID=UPI0020CF1985|nr:hypothetical protein [Synechococcus sp. EJ6-Ellesmere]MCP9824668.1 hypothetical protein [Synechococcus sp. EJ6-Ellesmere]
MASQPPGEVPDQPQTYPVAPLIRFTLLGLYLALVLPLPLLATPPLRPALTAALPLGFVLVAALLSERVRLDQEGITVGHPRWCAWLLRRGWQLPWGQLEALTSVGTSQGGRVYYLRSRDGRRLLLPQRVARFPAFLLQVQRTSGLDLSGVGRISPAWTYWALAGLSLTMLLGELVVITTWPMDKVPSLG